MSPLNPFPWFRAYTAEIDDLHGQFSPAECWAYMLIQRAIWQRGPIPPAEVQKAARVHGNAWKPMWQRLMPLFELRPELGGWTQPRLEAERASAARNLDQKSEAGRARHRKHVDNLTGAEHFGAASAISATISHPISTPKNTAESSKFNNLASADAQQIEKEKENLKYPTNPKREVALSAKSLPQQRREVGIIEQVADRSIVSALEASELTAGPVDAGSANGFAVAWGSTDDRATTSLPVDPDRPAYTGVTQQDQTISASAVVIQLPAAKEPRGSRLPDGWRPSSKEWQFALDRGLEPEKVLEIFTSHFKAKAGQAARMADWNMAWHKWCLRERPQQQRQQAGLPLMSVTRSTAPLDPNDKWGIEAWCTAHPDIKLIEGSDATPAVLAKGKWGYGGKIFDHVAGKVAVAAGFGRDQRIDWTLLMAWVAAGHAVNDHIIPKVQRLADFMRSKDNPPRSLKVFDKTVAEGAGQKHQAPPKASYDPLDAWGIRAWCASLIEKGIATEEMQNGKPMCRVHDSYVNALAHTIATTARISPMARPDWTPILDWLKAGIRGHDIHAAIYARVLWNGYQTPRSLRYFDSVVREGRAA
jgi:uncharacterized protein YdaU (DUF1376 family)